MGHVRLGTLPRTRKWRDVLELIGGSGDAMAVASATMEATARELLQAGEDPTVVHTMWLIAQLPQAARQDDFVEALRQVGIDVAATPSLVELATAVGFAVDEHNDNECPAPTDLGEMARLSAVETITRVVEDRVSSMFGVDPGTIQHEVGRLGTPKEFGAFSREFFGRLVERALTYFVSRELPLHVGPGKRFKTMEEQEAFSRAVADHARQAAKIVESFAGGWYSKARMEGDLTPERTSRFVAYAMKKLRSELTRETV